jgi:N-methylhydantoinase A
MTQYFVGVDIGGTFTDAFVSDGTQYWEGKAETTPAGLHEGLLNALTAAASEIGISRADLLSRTRILTHGSTIITNILAQLNGAKTGFITTSGFRDLVNIARSPRTNDLDYFTQMSPPELVTRDCIVEVEERVDYAGRPVVSLNEKQARERLRYLVEVKGCEAIAVCFLFSFKYPAHERAVRRLVEEMYPDVYVSISCEISPVFREYERMMSTILNAYSGRGFARYMNEVESRLAEAGFKGSFLVMQSNGGSLSADEARIKPITLAVSGPAGGIVSAKYLGGMIGEDNLLTADMGGTSFDTSVIYQREPITQSRARIDRFNTNLPVLDITAIGAGGGSIAWIDNRGMLRVGPRSAGAVPGPVAYGRGGTEPTVTDAAVVLGLIDPDYFLGGSIKLDKTRAAEAILHAIAEPLSMSAEEAAVGIYRTISASMGNALRNVTIEKGYDPRDFVLVAYGGCSALFIANISRELNIRSIIIPERAAVFSAFGACVADVKRDVAQTFYHSLPLPIAEVNQLFDRLSQQALALVERDGIEASAIALSYEADMRIHGQIWEIAVPLSTVPLSDVDGSEAVYEAFKAEYARKYGEGLVGALEQCDVLNLRVIAIGLKPKPKIIRFSEPRSSNGADALKGRRRLFLPEAGNWGEVDIIDGERLASGMSIDGPCVIERKNTTIYVPPEWHLEVDDYHNCLLRHV